MAQICWPWRMVARYANGKEIEVGGNSEEDCVERLATFEKKHGRNEPFGTRKTSQTVHFIFAVLVLRQPCRKLSYMLPVSYKPLHPLIQTVEIGEYPTIPRCCVLSKAPTTVGQR